MTIISKQLVLLAMLSTFIGCRTTSDSTLKLVGGKNAIASDFPSTLIWTSADVDLAASYCTGSKIAPNMILTAAHCVLEQENVSERAYWGPWKHANSLKPKKSISYSFSRVIDDGAIRETARVVKIHIPDAVQKCVDAPDQNKKLCYFRVPSPDVAIVELKPKRGSSFAKAPSVAIDTGLIKTRTSIYVMGYGSQKKSYTGPTRMKYVASKVSSNARLNKALAKTFAAQDGLPNWNLYFGYVSGLNSRTHSNLGFGDSGGPVYNADRDKIVGINSDGYCSEDRSCDATSNSIFARLSGSTGEWVTSFLK